MLAICMLTHRNGCLINPFKLQLVHHCHDMHSNMLQELLSEMDEFNSAAAAGTLKPKNMHNPACECVVCTNRRRYEERKQQEAADSARAAAAAAGASEDEQAAAAAAAAAAVANSAAEAAEAAESRASKPPPLPKGEVRVGMLLPFPACCSLCILCVVGTQLCVCVVGTQLCALHQILTWVADVSLW
jgi:hypothetical protein